MRVLVDTSVWADFFNGHSSLQAEVLARLIWQRSELVTCGLIASEVLQGFRQQKTIASVESHFRDMEWLTPNEPDTYINAAHLFRQLRGRGITIRSTIDCVIASLAAAHDVLILSKDRDLALIIESKLLRVHAMPLA
jgi:predicted nucleic acid-binding protein